MTIKEIRQLTNLSQSKFCDKYGIPIQTLRQWEQGHRSPPDYLVELLEFKVRKDLSMEELIAYLDSEIGKAEKLLKKEEQRRKENRSNPLFNNETSIACIECMLMAYHNVFDRICNQQKTFELVKWFFADENENIVAETIKGINEEEQAINELYAKAPHGRYILGYEHFDGARLLRKSAKQIV